MTATKRKSRKSRTGGQPGRCFCCSLPGDKRAILEKLHCDGASYESLAKRFGTTRFSVMRHCKAHLSRERRIELMAGPIKIGNLVNQAADESRTVLEMYQVTRSLLFSRMLAAAEAGDNFGTSSVGRVLIDLLDKLGRLTGELREMAGLVVNNTQINIGAPPEFAALEESLSGLIRKYPETRVDVVAIIRQIQASLAGGPNAARYQAEPVLIEGDLGTEMVEAERVQ